MLSSFELHENRKPPNTLSKAANVLKNEAVLVKVRSIAKLRTLCEFPPGLCVVNCIGHTGLVSTRSTVTQMNTVSTTINTVSGRTIIFY